MWQTDYAGIIIASSTVGQSIFANVIIARLCRCFITHSHSQSMHNVYSVYNCWIHLVALESCILSGRMRRCYPTGSSNIWHDGAYRRVVQQCLSSVQGSRRQVPLETHCAGCGWWHLKHLLVRRETFRGSVRRQRKLYLYVAQIWSSSNRWRSRWYPAANTISCARF